MKINHAANLLTIPGVAKALDVNETTARRAVDKSGVAFRIARARCVPADKLEEVRKCLKKQS